MSVMLVKGSPPATPLTWYELLSQIPEDDGDWWIVKEVTNTNSAHTIASLLRTGARKSPPGRWEFKGGRTDHGAAVWARRVLKEKEL